MFRLLRFVRGAAVAAVGLRMARDALSHRRFHDVLLATAVIKACLATIEGKLDRLLCGAKLERLGVIELGVGG